MGWSSGSIHAETLIKVLSELNLDDETREKIYSEMIDVWESDDWDTQDEVMGQDDIFDKLIKEKNPVSDWEED